MSGIAGIFNLDGSAVNQGQLSRMADSIKGRGPDGIKIRIEGSIGLVHSHFWTTPEDMGEEQPISDTGGRYWIVADARVDNRGELLPLLRRYLTKGEPTDAEIILAAFQHWGDDCAQHIIGDFAFAIWDVQEQRLFCVRDPAGVRLFHYARMEDALIFGSSVGSVLAAFHEMPDINLPLIGDLLACRFERWVNETAYKGIFRLAPSYQLTATPREINLKRYWIYGAHPIHFNSDEEYIKRFREIFKEAVRARMRAVGPIGLLVSGGLDSSSIACVFDDIICSGDVKATGRIYSSTGDGIPTADETEYLNAVLEKCKHLELTLLPSDLWRLDDFGTDGEYPLDDPSTAGGRNWLQAAMRMARGDLCRVLIGGHWGDQVVNGEAYFTPVLLKDVDLLRLPAELRHFRNNSDSILHLLAYAYLVEFIPEDVKIRLGHWLSDLRNESILKQYSHSAKPYNFLAPPTFASKSSQIIYDALSNGSYSRHIVNFNNWAANVPIEWRFPYLDKRLIELMLSIPPRLIFRNGFSKYLLRCAMAGTLPEIVRKRTNYGYTEIFPNNLVSKQDRKRIEELYEQSYAVKLGYIDSKKLSEAWYRYWQDMSFPPAILVRFLCAELWLRYYEQQCLELRHDPNSPKPF